jgi:hypothetical protein
MTNDQELLEIARQYLQEQISPQANQKVSKNCCNLYNWNS